MLDPNLMETVALVSGPALLTNASALLLAGATNRFHLALEEQRRRPAPDWPPVGSSSTSKRARLSAAAVHALHFALIAFGVNCALLLAMGTVGPTMVATKVGLNAVGLVLEFVGLAGLTSGVVLLAAEGLFGFKS